MSGTIIGPGTIFLMLVGAFVAAFKISNWLSFYYNLIPIVVYVVVCLVCKPSWQLLLSSVLSTAYALVMMAVIVGTALQVNNTFLNYPDSSWNMEISSHIQFTVNVMKRSKTYRSLKSFSDFCCFLSYHFFMYCSSARTVLVLHLRSFLSPSLDLSSSQHCYIRRNSGALFQVRN